MIDPERHTLTVLTRMASRHPGQAAWLEQALRGRLDKLAEKAFEAALAELTLANYRAAAAAAGREPDPDLLSPIAAALRREERS